MNDEPNGQEAEDYGYEMARQKEVDEEFLGGIAEELKYG